MLAYFGKKTKLESVQFNFIYVNEEVHATEAFYADCIAKFQKISNGLESTLGKATDGRFIVDEVSYSFPKDISKAFAHAALSNESCKISFLYNDVILTLHKLVTIPDGMPAIILSLHSTIYFSSYIMYQPRNFEGDHGDYLYE